MVVDLSASAILLRFAGHLDSRRVDYIPDGTGGQMFTLKVDSLTVILITLLIPVYLCLLRPFIHKYVPGVLKRIGFGMIFIFLSTLCTSVMDAYGHIHANVSVCFLTNDPYNDHPIHPALNINYYSLVTRYFLNALGYMLLYIAVYEFICAQSPHAMKGLFTGTFFAIKGVFQLFGAVAAICTWVEHCTYFPQLWFCLLAILSMPS